MPPLGFIHVDGQCLKANGGSRYNPEEAQTIAAWIKEYSDKLKSRYTPSIEKTVAILSPFGAQIKAIREAIKKQCPDINVDPKSENSLIIGTVHSLQGAERPIVIFSPVYTEHDNGTFIDDKPNMLNVAVSRAKDSFIVFGDMNTFDSSDRLKPRGMMASYLYQKPENEIIFTPAVRQNFVASKEFITVLHNYPAHQEFIQQALLNAKNGLMIISPWISHRAIQDLKILPWLRQGVQRGLLIYLYTDYELNVKFYKDGENKLQELYLYLKQFNIHLVFVKNVHSKILITDKNLLCIGSFNWLSAAAKGRYMRYETSMIYKTADIQKCLGQEIQRIKEDLNERRIKFELEQKDNPKLTYYFKDRVLAAK